MKKIKCDNCNGFSIKKVANLEFECQDCGKRFGKEDVVVEMKKNKSKQLKFIVLIASIIAVIAILVFTGFSIAEEIQYDRAENMEKSLNERYFLLNSENEFSIFSFKGGMVATFYASLNDEHIITYYYGDLSTYEAYYSCSLDLSGNARVYIGSNSYKLYYDSNWRATTFGSAEEVTLERAEEIIETAKNSYSSYKAKQEQVKDQNFVVGTWDYYCEYDTVYETYEAGLDLYSTISFYSDGTGKITYNTKYYIASEFKWVFHKNEDGVRTYKAKLKSGSSSTYYAVVSQSRNALMWVFDGGGRYVSVFT